MFCTSDLETFLSARIPGPFCGKMIVSSHSLDGRVLIVIGALLFLSFFSGKSQEICVL